MKPAYAIPQVTPWGTVWLIVPASLSQKAMRYLGRNRYKCLTDGYYTLWEDGLISDLVLPIFPWERFDNCI